MWPSIINVVFAFSATLAFPVGNDKKPLEQNRWQTSGKFEGDMILNDEQNENWNRQDRNGMNNTKFRWPDAELVYGFDKNVSQDLQILVKTAMDEFTSRSCVRFRKRGKSDRDYVLITTSDEGCSSMIGRVGGAQQLNLEQGCWTSGTIQHEFLHAFGFYHMHSDPSRDHYVLVFWKNIQAEQKKNFQVNKDSTMFGYKYDYGSVMHYNSFAFSKNGGPTMAVLNHIAVIGQDRGMSRIDVKKLNAMYECN